MKIIKTASGKKLRLSRKEWEEIGKKAQFIDHPEPRKVRKQKRELAIQKRQREKHRDLREQAALNTHFMKHSIFGPGFADYLGTKEWKDKFGDEVTTDLIIDGEPVIMSTQLDDGFQSMVVMVEHKGEHIGVYVPSDGFDFTYTKHIEPYGPYIEDIQSKAIEVLRDGNSKFHEDHPTDKNSSNDDIVKVAKMNKMEKYLWNFFEKRMRLK